MKRAERHQIVEVVNDLRRWALVVAQIRWLAAHLPITGSTSFATDDELLLAQVESSVRSEDPDEALRLASSSFFDGRRKLATAREAADRLTHLHEWITAIRGQARLESMANQVSESRAVERTELVELLQQLGSIDSQCHRLLVESQHLPITRSDPISGEERNAAESLAAVLAEHSSPARTVLDDASCRSGACAPAHASARVLRTVEAEGAGTSLFSQLEQTARRVAALSADEQQKIPVVLKDVRSWADAAGRALHDASHLPLSAPGWLSVETHAELTKVVDLSARFLDDALATGPLLCETGACEVNHRATAVLSQFHDADPQTKILAAADLVTRRLSTERREAAAFLDLVQSWGPRIISLRNTREEAAKTVSARTAQLMNQAASFKVEGRSVKLLPLKETDRHLVTNLAILRDRALTDADEAFLNGATAVVERTAAAVRTGFTKALKCKGDGICAEAHQVLPQVHASSGAIVGALDRLGVDRQLLPAEIDLLVAPEWDFLSHLGQDLRSPELVPAALVERLGEHLTTVLYADEANARAAAKAREAAEKVRSADLARSLKAMDLEVLRKASNEPVRVAPLQDYDLNSVWDVYRFQEEYLLSSLSGLGSSTAEAITRAVIRIFEAVREETPVRIDVKRKSKRTELLLQALRDWDAARKFEPSAAEAGLARALTTLTRKKLPVDNLLATWVDGDAPVSLTSTAEAILDRLAPQDSETDVWTDFLTRPADYFGLLTELGFMTEDEKKMHGDLPEEIVEAVRAKELRRDYLTASLRAYQSFGARFALVQEKVVIGDEMGLGKTVEALAVFTHLRAGGRTHFLVVCPAAVVSNWVRETAKHTTLSAFRLHGPSWEREAAAKAWARTGGVAVTTYDLLPWASQLLDGTEVGCAVFDEAHYIKNPAARRSILAAEIIDSLRYAILMTGTPLENSVQEFRNLVGYLRPDLSESAPEYLASKFRKHVAPAYLRRNQEDVLTELPDLVEIDEWMGMSPEDERSYRAAVESGQFMLMRRTAMLSERSLKVERLNEIVAEAEANGRRVIVFSYFREVLAEVAALLPGDVYGPMTGSLPAAQRQGLVDKFSAADGGAVLVAQITAGGVGLNIQSASVVVLCEPQLKPTTESQAIARAHRMGQTKTVQVHRLLTENSVDERIREILSVKRDLFDEFARDSVIAKQAPDSVDVTDADVARLVVEAERERLFGQGTD